MEPRILFATKCWGADWDKFLAGALERKTDAIGYPFTERWLLVNNGVPEADFKADRVIRVDQHDEETLEHFNLKYGDFDGGYNYSIAELVCLYLADGFDYLCWVQGDCLPERGDWVTKGIEILENDYNISVISPGSEVNTWGEIDQFFSDQSFLVRVKEFRKQIYNYDEPELPQYPPHGGQSFERRAARYLRNNGKGRRVLYDFTYIHPAW